MSCSGNGYKRAGTSCKDVPACNLIRPIFKATIEAADLYIVLLFQEAFLLRRFDQRDALSHVQNILSSKWCINSKMQITLCVRPCGDSYKN